MQEGPEALLEKKPPSIKYGKDAARQRVCGGARWLRSQRDTLALRKHRPMQGGLSPPLSPGPQGSGGVCGPVCTPGAAQGAQPAQKPFFSPSQCLGGSVPEPAELWLCRNSNLCSWALCGAQPHGAGSCPSASCILPASFSILHPSCILQHPASFSPLHPSRILQPPQAPEKTMGWGQPRGCSALPSRPPCRPHRPR